MLEDSRQRIMIGRYFRQLTEKELLALDKLVVSFKKTLSVAAADRKLESAERAILQKAIVALDAKISAYRTNDVGVPQPVDKLAAAFQKKAHSLAYKAVKCYMGGTIVSKKFKWFASVEREILDNVYDQQKTGLLTKVIYDNAIKRIEVLDKAVTEECTK
jgi:hypothetical protein